MSNDMSMHLSGLAISADAGHLFTEIAEHFVEHAQVMRQDNRLTLISPLGTARIVHSGDRLNFDLTAPRPKR